MMSIHLFFLAIRTEKRAPGADPDPCDARSAPDAGLAFPPIDRVMLLKSSRDSVGIGEIPDGGSFFRYGFPENGPHGFPKLPDVFPAKRRRGCERMHPGPEENLVGVDVPDSGDEGLIEEEALYAAFPAADDLFETAAIQGKRFGTEAIQLWNGSRRLRAQTDEKSESPDVAEAQFQIPFFEEDAQAGMFVDGDVRSQQKHLPGHLQVEDEGPAGFAVDQDHFSPAAEAGDFLPFDPVQNSDGCPAEKPRAEKTDGLHLGSPDSRVEPPDDGFDFGKLRHEAIVQ